MGSGDTGAANRGGSLLSAGDATLRTVGTVKLWWDIISGVIGFVIVVVLIVALARYHARWRSEQAKVVSISCDKPQMHTSCQNGTEDCSTSSIQSCKLRVDGFKQEFVTNYDEGKAPSVGGAVKVYYDPTDRSTALLAKDDGFDNHKTMLLWVLVVIGIVTIVSVVVQFLLRKNKLAQRVAGGAAVFDLATGGGF